MKSGQILVKIPRSVGKTRDITGGLPRVTELFEARNPSNPAVVSEIDGVVTYGGIKRGNREIIIESKDGVIKKYMVSLSKHILFRKMTLSVPVNHCLMEPSLQMTSFPSKAQRPFRNIW